MGGYKWLTLWCDGRSEGEVMPIAIIPNVWPTLRAKKGWTETRQEHQVIFIRNNVFPPEIVRKKLQEALEAGIQSLQTFQPRYRDGSGTRVVVQTHPLIN